MSKSYRPTDDPRATLGLPPAATQEEAERRFRDELRLHHPDRPGGSATRTRALVAAIEAIRAEVRPRTILRATVAADAPRPTPEASGRTLVRSEDRPLAQLDADRTHHEVLCVAVADASPSMDRDFGGGRTGRTQVGDALLGFLRVLRDDATLMGTSFRFAEIAFSGHAELVHPPRALAELDLSRAEPFVPVVRNATGTYVGAGLQAARVLTEEFMGGRGATYRSAVVLVLSDGECGAPSESRQAATQLDGRPRPISGGAAGGRVLIATTHFRPCAGGGDDGQALLRTLSSRPDQLFSVTHDAESLTRFFRRSTMIATGLRASI